MKIETVERMDYYHIPEGFNKYKQIEKKLIYSRYKFAVENIKSNSNILEVGCGYGSASKLLKEIGGKHNSYVGIDLSSNSISIAKKEYSEFGKFFESNAELLSIFPKNIFDNVISFENIEHVKNPRNSFLEIFRVLKRDGLLIISTPNRRNWGLADKNLYHFRHYTYCQIIAEAEECGFDLVKRSGIYFSPSNFKLSSIFSLIGLDISKIINKVPLFLDSFFLLGKLFPGRSRLMLFVFKKREHFPIERYYLL